MPVTINNFTYTNGNSGRTRVNEQGLIVGVDFSTTSNTIATGAKTFTLTATANVNRDWPVGSSLVAVAQAGATGSMIGTVTSYDPATQVLVMNVASITGSGTSTDWRIGSTMVRELNGIYDFRTYNPLTMQPAGLVEGGATNLAVGSNTVTAVGVTITANNAASPEGSINASTVAVTANGTGAYAQKTFTLVSGNFYTASVYILAGTVGTVSVDLLRGPTVLARMDNITLQSGFNRILLPATSAADGTNGLLNIYPTGRLLAQTAGQSIQVFGVQVELGSVATSHIPTTTVSVTRAADQLAVDGTNFGQFYNPSQGTLVMELTPIAQAVGAVAGSLNDGTLNNAIRIQQKQSGTLSSIRKMATDGVTDVMAVNNSVNNTLVSNGVDYTEVATQSANAQFAVASSGLGSFLSVGATENFRNSADSGLTYNARTIGGTFGGAHFGIGRWVIAGSTSVINGATVGSVITSTDGLAFRRFNIAGLTQQLNEITSNGVDQYVAVGAGGVIYTSPESQNWTPQTSGVATAFNAVDFGGGTYVAVNATAANSRYSTNGTTWTAITGLTGTMTDVKYTGSQWVAVNTIGGVFTSADGITFAAVSTTGISPAFTSAQGITFGTVSGTGYYVIVGNGGQVAVCTAAAGASPATWVTYTNGGSPSTGTTAQLNEVLLFGTKFYIVGATQTVVEFDPVGLTFLSRTSNVTATLNGIATNGSRLLICGTSGAITTSDDGTTFTSRTGNAATLNGAAFGNGTYVVVGNAVNGSGLIATVNPTTFEYQRRVSNTAQLLSCAVNNASRFIVGGNASIVRYSDDAAQSWQSVTIGGTFNVLDIAVNGSTLIAVGSGGRYSISTDNGTTWAASALNGVNTQQLNGAAFFGGNYVAVGNAGTIITSPNGTTWTLRTSGITSTLHSVMYSTRDSQWYAAGDNGVILRATDPTGTWTSIANDATVGIFTAGALQANPLAGKFLVNQKNRVAIGWTSTGGVSISINGGDVVTDPSVTMPVLTQYSVGMNGLSGQHWNSTIKTQRSYRVRVSDDELKALSRV